jgi:hypothetical protein
MKIDGNLLAICVTCVIIVLIMATCSVQVYN